MSNKDLKIKKPAIMAPSDLHPCATVIDKIMMGVQETQEAFIFNTISPFVQGISSMEISKEELADAVMLLRICKEYGFDIHKRYNNIKQDAKALNEYYVRGYNDGVKKERARILYELNRPCEEDDK